MKFALAGNPNCGKTTMFNALTGRNERVGNRTGVTVEKREHRVKKSFYPDGGLTVVDLPGTYSLSPFTGEESITSTYIKEEAPDVIINIVDATNLSRSLFFTTELLELAIPTVIALNKSDISKRKETEIDTERLSTLLGCPVLKTTSTRGQGLKAVIEAAVSVIRTVQGAPFIGKSELSDRASSEADDRRRFDFVKSVVSKVESRAVPTKNRAFGDRIDEILTNRWLGIPIFAAVMLLVFMISQTWLGPWIADGFTLNEGAENELTVPGFVTLLEGFQGFIGELLEGASPILSALLVDGIIGGVIAVIGFLPLVMVMYFLIALLEDCGYMSRVSALLDPIFKKVGLSGKSVIPFVITVGCAVPGIMASRTIKNERERRATAMLAPFIPCGAKIPVIALIAGAFFDNAGWVSALVYLLGILLIFIGALTVKAISGYKAGASYFIIEFPEYKIPSVFGAFKSMCSNGYAYIVKATTIILLCNTAVQVMQSFTWRLTVAESASDSILAALATPFAYLLLPVVGVLSWQLAAAAVTGFIAKENVVGTLAVCFVGLENLIDTEALAILAGSGADVAGIIAISKLSALAYLAFNLYTPPCFAAIGAMNSEMKSGRWVWAGIGLQLGVGFTVGYLIYTIGTLITAPETLNIGAALGGLLAIIIFIGTLFTMIIYGKRQQKAVSGE